MSQFSDEIDVEFQKWTAMMLDKKDAEITRLRADLAAVTEERDALAARLAPVDDKALVEVAAVAIRRNKFKRTGRLDCFDPSNLTPEDLGEGRAAIDAIRPHIEAAERERCEKKLIEACELLHRLTAIIPGNDGAGEQVAKFLRSTAIRRGG